jgi:hypothetical protein
MKILVMRFSQASCYFFSPSSKYSSRYSFPSTFSRYSFPSTFNAFLLFMWETSCPFLFPRPFQKFPINPRPIWHLVTCLVFLLWGEDLLAIRSTFKIEDHPLSAVCIFSIRILYSLYLRTVATICSLRTCHAMMKKDPNFTSIRHTLTWNIDL